MLTWASANPASASDWMSDEGKRKLLAYGIAPPSRRTASNGPVLVNLSVRCPRCGSGDTRER